MGAIDVCGKIALSDLGSPNPNPDSPTQRARFRGKAELVVRILYYTQTDAAAPRRAWNLPRCLPPNSQESRQVGIKTASSTLPLPLQPSLYIRNPHARLSYPPPIAAPPPSITMYKSFALLALVASAMGVAVE